MGFEKAVIRRRLQNKDEDVMKVQFNPETYTLVRSTNYSEIIPIGKEAIEGKLQYKNSGFYDFNTMLLIDNYATKEDVRQEVKKLSSFLDKNPRTHLPDKIIFAWGSFIFSGVLINMRESYTMFHSNGTPIRARIEIGIKGNLEELKIERKSGSVTEKIAPVVGVQQLWQIAQEEYGNPDKWKEIAQINGILNPRKIQSSQIVKVR